MNTNAIRAYRGVLREIGRTVSIGLTGCVRFQELTTLAFPLVLAGLLVLARFKSPPVFRRFQAIQPRGQRNTAILGMLRSIVSDPQATASPTFEREMMEMKEFLKAGRIHSVSNRLKITGVVYR